MYCIQRKQGCRGFKHDTEDAAVETTSPSLHVATAKRKQIPSHAAVEPTSSVAPRKRKRGASRTAAEPKPLPLRRTSQAATLPGAPSSSLHSPQSTTDSPVPRSRFPRKGPLRLPDDDIDNSTVTGDCASEEDDSPPPPPTKRFKVSRQLLITPLPRQENNSNTPIHASLPPTTTSTPQVDPTPTARQTTSMQQAGTSSTASSAFPAIPPGSLPIALPVYPRRGLRFDGHDDQLMAAAILSRCLRMYAMHDTQDD